jgi:CCR4-NOT transcription complex subunit 3
MAEKRKLLTEIQQTLKKVDEGVLIFDEIWEKVYSATQQTLKEKYETDLKKEIKKLQRLRDQIKAWISSSDVKDKNGLVEARKTIENKMEQFKVCEKDTKTKAFSKEGLARETKLDPKEAMREEKREWINVCLERLSDLINSVEADKEKITAAKGKPTKANKEQLEKYDNQIVKHRWHETRLELIIKLMDNDDLDPALLDGVKDNLEYYLESAAEDDGAVGVEDEFDIYEDLKLDTIVPESELLKGTVAAEEEAAAAKEAAEAEAAAAEAKKSAAKTGKATATPAKTAATVAAPPNLTVIPKVTSAGIVKTAAAVVASNLLANNLPLLTPASKPPALTQASKPLEKKSGATVVSLASIVSSVNAATHGDDSTEPIVAAVPTSTPVSWATAAAAATQQPVPAAVPVKTAASVVAAGLVSPPAATPVVVSTPVPAAVPVVVAPTPVSATQPPVLARVSSVEPPAAKPATPAPVLIPASPVVTAASVPASPAPSLLSAATPLPPLQQKMSPEMVSALNMLKCSMMNAPESLETDKVPSYTPRNFYQHTHPSYPTVPLFATQAENTAWFERLPMDTLFFVFYFQQGTYQQFLAARQLKKHSWRFHKKYMTWFQRHEEPKIATEEYEEGTYVYFDYESGEHFIIFPRLM